MLEKTKIKVHDEMCRPVAAYEAAAGLDLKCGEDLFLEPFEMKKVSLGLSTHIPEGLCALVIPRSSCTGWRLENFVGLIDSDYRGVWFAKIRNTSGAPIFIPKGERILQAVILPHLTNYFEFVNEISNETTRGGNGDGSSGKQ